MHPVLRGAILDEFFCPNEAYPDYGKREKRKLSLEEIEHYMRVAKAIERTREVEAVFEWAVVAIG